MIDVLKKHGAWLLILLLLVAWPYWQVGKLGFSWIEPAEILQGQLIVTSWQEFWQMLVANDQNFVGYHRPVYNLVLSLDWYLWEDNPAGHHYTTLLFHLANVGLVYACCHKLRGQRWLSFGIALAWGLLPVHSAVVAMIVGKSDVVPFFFLVLTLLGALTVADDKDRSQRSTIIFMILTGVAFFLALFSKESVLVLPLFLAVFFLLVPGRNDKRRAKIILITMLGLLAAGYVIFRWSIRSVISPQLTEWSLLDRVLTFMSVYAGYLTHSLPAIELTKNDAVTLWSMDPTFGFSVVVVLVWLVVMVVIWRQVPPARAGLIWFHLFLLPVAQIFPILHFRADRFLYLPSLGLVWALACVVEKVIGRHQFPRWRRYVFWGTAALVVVFFSLRIHARIPDFRNDLTHFSSLVVEHPECREAQSFLAQAYFNDGQIDKARDAFRQALQESSHVHSYVHRSSLYGSYARFLIAQQRYEEAYEIFRAGRKPHYLSNTLHDFYFGVCCRRLGRFVEAQEAFAAHLKVMPDDASAWYLFASTCLDLGDYPEAWAAFQRYLELAPDAPDAPKVQEIIQQLNQHLAPVPDA